MFTVRAGDILDADQAFKTLATEKMPASVSFKIARLIRALDSEYDDLMKTLRELIEKYAEPGEDGNKISSDGHYVIPKDNVAAYNTEYNTLYNQLVELNANKIPASAMDAINLNINEALALEPFIEE